MTFERDVVFIDTPEVYVVYSFNAFYFENGFADVFDVYVIRSCVHQDVNDFGERNNRLKNHISGDEQGDNAINTVNSKPNNA